MPFSIIRDDITRVKADAIVNTANPKPAIGAGTDNAIYTAAGKEKLLAARKLIGDIKPGDAIETAAYNLDAKYIIHTVCIAWDFDNEAALDTLKSCYKNSLDLALELNCKSIAFPLIGTGAYGFPHDEAVEIAKTVSKKFLKETGSDMKIMLVVFDKDSYESTAAVAKKIKQYIDDNYVENAVVDEYGLTEEDRHDMSTIRRRRERYFHGASNRHFSRDEQAELDAVYDDAAKPFSVKVFELADKKGIKALVAIDSFDGSKDVRAWLFTIAKNTFLSECRKRKWIADEEVSEEIPAAEGDFIEVISDKETAVLIHKYLHGMKEPYKEVFHLRVFGELEFEQIGDIFGKSASWARVTFYRAKNEIRKFMSENGEL